MQTRIVPLFLACLVLSLGASMAAAVEGQQAAYFDTDRQAWLYDTDGDGTVDLTEEILGTDPLDAADFPSVGEQPAEAPHKVGFPTSSCRTNFQLVGTRLCIDQHEQNATRYDNAQLRCRNRRARVCTYEDLYYLYRSSTMDGSYDPFNMWLGDFVHDDLVLCGNKFVDFNDDPDINNFEGHCSKNDSKKYYCCHDRE